MTMQEIHDKLAYAKQHCEKLKIYSDTFTLNNNVVDTNIEAFIFHGFNYLFHNKFRSQFIVCRYQNRYRFFFQRIRI